MILAKHKKTSKVVAIKLIEDFADSEYNCIKLLREISLMQSLNGSSISPELFEAKYYKETICEMTKDGSKIL